MTNEMSIFAIYGLVALGIGAAIVDFFKTPKETRYRVPRPPSLEEQLKTLPESTQAIILRANKKRALVRLIPLLFIGVTLIGFGTWFENTSHPECVRIFGLSVAYIAFLFVCYGTPIAFFIWSIICIPEGISTIKTGYSPPLNAVLFQDVIAKKGIASMLHGVAWAIILPLLTAYGIYLGNDIYSLWANGRNMHEITKKFEAKCPRCIAPCSSGVERKRAAS